MGDGARAERFYNVCGPRPMRRGGPQSIERGRDGGSEETAGDLILRKPVEWIVEKREVWINGKGENCVRGEGNNL